MGVRSAIWATSRVDAVTDTLPGRKEYADATRQWVAARVLRAARGACARGPNRWSHRRGGIQCPKRPGAPSSLGQALSLGIYRDISHGNHPLGAALVCRCLPLWAGPPRL